MEMVNESVVHMLNNDCGCYDVNASLSEKLESKFRHLWGLVGNTPMIEIAYKYKGECRKIFIKCENYNLTGSIKDRMALYILQQAYRQNKIKQGDIIVEATSGNTGVTEKDLKEMQERFEKYSGM